MAIPTIVIREMIPLAPGEPVEHSLGELTPENFYAAEGEKFKGADGEFFTLGEPIVANEKAWRKRRQRALRKDEKFKAKEDAHNLKRRADPVYKERAIADTKKFLETNPDYKRNWDSEFYHRPFVIVDSERCRVKGAPPAIINGEADALGRMPAMGFLHDGRKPGRLSLVWDCIEPLRPGLVSVRVRRRASVQER
jgi:hypothetical protein